MDHSASAQRFYDLINAGDIDAFIGLLADDFGRARADARHCTGARGNQAIVHDDPGGVPRHALGS